MKKLDKVLKIFNNKELKEKWLIAKNSNAVCIFKRKTWLHSTRNCG